MEQCCGTLLVHEDGTAAACTEELAGRCCPGPVFSHLGGSVPCTALLGPEGCELCGCGLWCEPDWGHVTRLAGYARTQRRCALHRPCRPGPGTPGRDQAPRRRPTAGQPGASRRCGRPVVRPMRGRW
jgi:hypothetical protein